MRTHYAIKKKKPMKYVEVSRLEYNYRLWTYYSLLIIMISSLGLVSYNFYFPVLIFLAAYFLIRLKFNNEKRRKPR